LKDKIEPSNEACGDGFSHRRVKVVKEDAVCLLNPVGKVYTNVISTEKTHYSADILERLVSL
jgi:hypothetical protein